MLDDVHGRHGEPRAVDDAADVAGEADIVKTQLGGLGLAGIFFRGIAHLRHARPTEHRVVVERHLGIEREHAIILGDDQRVDLDHGGIEIAKRTIATHDRGHGLAHLLDVEAKSEGELTRLESLQSDGRVDLLLQDGLGSACRDFLDFDAALSRGDDPNALDLAVQDEAQDKARAHKARPSPHTVGERPCLRVRSAR